MVNDCVLAAQETIFVLQEWLGQLERWQATGRAERDDFAEACLLLREAGLWTWARQVGGHGVDVLAQAIKGGDR